MIYVFPSERTIFQHLQEQDKRTTELDEAIAKIFANTVLLEKGIPALIGISLRKMSASYPITAETHSSIILNLPRILKACARAL